MTLKPPTKSSTPETTRPGLASPRRRRVIALMAAAGALSLAGIGAHAASPATLVRWRGIAMGAEARLILAHPDAAEARRIIDAAVVEMRRLERMFSLYDPGSDLSELNRTGVLRHPAPEWLELLGIAESISIATSGAFDVTIQPLWRLFADHFAKGGTTMGPPKDQVHTVRSLSGWRDLKYSQREIRLARSGMAVTLNGIAQGYVTDRIASLLRDAGMGDLLVDMGEIKGLGGHPDGRPWSIGVIDGPPVPLADCAIATSAPGGTIFEPSGGFHHLFDPSSGWPRAQFKRLSVIAPSAALADGLSTGLTIGGMESIDGLKTALDGAPVGFRALTLDDKLIAWDHPSR